MDNVLFIPCYMTLVIKRLSNISIQSGTIDCKYTLVLRIPKMAVPEHIMADIKKSLLLRLNEDPISIGENYTN
jgi:hypothetical protein